ncbi:MAG: hypothetical protein WCS65_08765 [Verrucomicrobiae bacterium]
MRTTLTLDDDIALELRKIAASTQQGFKSVVNELLRRGLAAGPKPLFLAEPFVVKAKSCGFLPGIDPLKLNQLADEIESEDFIMRRQAKRSQP